MLGLLPVLLLVFILGFTALESDWSHSTSGGTRQAVSAVAQSQMFMAYRDAVLSYLEKKPELTASGAVPISALTFPTGMNVAGLPAGTSNYVVVSASTFTAYVFSSPIAGVVAAFNQEFPGDESIGTVTGNTWTSATGAVAPALPFALGNGDTISVFQIGN